MCLKVNCALGKLEIEEGREGKRKYFFSLSCISLGHFFLCVCLYSVLLTDFSLKKSLKQRKERQHKVVCRYILPSLSFFSHIKVVGRLIGSGVGAT